ncbi:MAG: FAD-dependent oxidoreductase [Candidatus Omnitrophica bacterium]|nr:FAD-dependent oxidoreductase [Candidatus Omnitrophota bacterium]
MKQVVIIGCSAAGVSAAAAMRATDPAAHITMVSDERTAGYRRMCLGNLLVKSKRLKDCLIEPPDFFDRLGITLALGSTVEKINPRRREVALTDKTKFPFDVCIVAGGRDAVFPRELRGAQKQGVFTFRSIAALAALEQLIPISSTACVWGAGIAGLTAAACLRQRGLEVKLITARQQLLPEFLDLAAAELLRRVLESRGIEILFEMDIREVIGESDVKAVRLNSGKVIGCELLVVDAFNAARARFLSDTDIAVTEQGIAVDQFLQTSNPAIFAAGDCVDSAGEADTPPEKRYVWARATAQGRAAGANAALFLSGGAMQPWPAAYAAEKTCDLFDYLLSLRWRTPEEMPVPAETKIYFDEAAGIFHKRTIGNGAACAEVYIGPAADWGSPTAPGNEAAGARGGRFASADDFAGGAQ